MKIELNNIHIEGIGQVTGTVGFSLGLPATRFEPEEPAEVATIELVDADGKQVDEDTIWEDAAKLEALESKIWELYYSPPRFKVGDRVRHIEEEDGDVGTVVKMDGCSWFGMVEVEWSDNEKIWHNADNIEQAEESRPDNDLVKVESVWEELHKYHPLMGGEGQ